MISYKKYILFCLINMSYFAGFEPLTWLTNTSCYEHRYVGIAFLCNMKYKAYFSSWLYIQRNGAAVVTRKKPLKH